MYDSYFGLQQDPFSIAPDPRFLYMSDKHREALAMLRYGLTRGASFVLLTGEIGAGKTTVWRRFLEELPSNFDVASVVNPKLDVVALLARICEDLNVELPANVERHVDLIDELHGQLLLAQAEGRRWLIAIDEAQALSNEVLEQLRLLTNLDISGRKLQIMLIGQPELREMLERPLLEPVAQRVVARYHLPALSDVETAGYIAHRLAVAGLTGPLPFDGEALQMIQGACHGIPRRINVLCGRAMGLAQAAGTQSIDRGIVERAANEVFGAVPLAATVSAPTPAPRVVTPGALGWALAGVAALALVAGALIGPDLMPAPARPSASTVPPVSATPAGLAVTATPLTATVPPLRPPSSGVDDAFGAPTSSEELAWRALAVFWGVVLGSGEPCSAAPAQALQCLRSRGGLAMIRRLDRPSILRLVDGRGRVANVLLTGLVGEDATISVGGVVRSVPVAELARWWRGEFATYWLAPPGYRKGRPANDELTSWLTRRLAGVDALGSMQADEAALRARILAFQATQGLTPDGVPGPLTLMQLNRVSGVDEPRLELDDGGGSS